MANPWEMDWGQGAQPAAPVPDVMAKAPWEMDWGKTAQEAAPSKDFMTKLGETSWGKLAKDVYSAVTLPGDVYAGKVDPGSEEAIGRAFETAKIFNPLPAAMRAGEGIFAVPITTKPGMELSPGIQAATTANELGAPLPVGLAGGKIMQASTKAAQQLPFVGPKIGEGAAATVNAAGERVGNIVDELSGGIGDRAAAGAILRPSIQGVIDTNKQRINEAYNAVRGLIDQRPVPIDTTEQVLKKIIAERKDAGHVNPTAGLEGVQNLVDNGATFNGLQRAKSDISDAVKWGVANPGFNSGDMMRLGGAMSRDLEGVAVQSAKPGVHPQVVADALRSANDIASPAIRFNKQLESLTGIKTDESLVGTLTGAAKEKTGNARLLIKLRQDMPQEEFQQISARALDELGHNPASGQFSLNQFVSNWNKTSDRAKGALFSPEHRADLEKIAQLGSHLKDADKFTGKSNTAAVEAWQKLIVGGSAAIGALAYGDVSLLMQGLAGGAGGMLAANQLAKPATAAKVATWTRNAVLAQHGQTPARLAAFRTSTQDLIENFRRDQPSYSNQSQ